MKLVPKTGLNGERALREAAATELGQIMGLVRAALQAKIGTNAYFGLESIFPDRAIVCKDGRYWQYTYTLAADNTVTVGEAQEVTEQWMPVREALNGADVMFVESAGSEGKVWDVILIKAGTSGNNVFYSDKLLREAAPLFEGARCYVKADEDHLARDSKNPEKIFGWFSAVKFVEGKAADTGMLTAQLNVAAGMSALRETITDAWKRGKKDLVALSINAFGKIKAAARKGGARIAESIRKVSSVDLIVEPGAGGALVRLVEAAADEEHDDMKLRDRMLEAIKTKAPAIFKLIDVDNITDEQLETRYAEALKVESDAAAAAAAAKAKTGGTENDDDRPMTRGEARMVEARSYLRTAISGSKLPQAAQDKLLNDWKGRERFTEADVDAAIKAEREYLARFTESGKVVIGTNGDIQVEDRSLKMADMLDAFFDPKHKNHRDVQSFKECYREFTGDKMVTGRWDQAVSSRMAESVGAALRESLSASTFSSVLGDSVARRMVAEFKAAVEFDGWRKIATSVPVNDFRTQDRTLFGGYGDLPTVAEGDPYTAATSPTDTQATYSVTKKGYTEDVTLEMIKNDDVGAIRRIPVKMGRAAKRTLAKFVFDFVKTNPTIYDSVAFFHSSHGNLGSTAFSATEYGVVRAAMMKQTERDSSDRMGIGPYGILCPVDLEAAVWSAFQRSTNNDKDFIQTLAPEIIPVWYWTDATDWAAVANPNDIPGIEIGFLDGQEEPQLFVQDQPNVGSMFSNDKITYKIRHIYGGNVLPGGEKAFYKEVVAG